MDKNQIILILALAALVTVAGIGSFLLTDAKDIYYNYVAYAPVSVKSGEAIQFTVKLAEKNGILKNCITPAPPQSNQLYPNYCSSFTYFNARSIRVLIDGTETQDFYFYPASLNGSTLSSPLNDMGAVSCFGAISPCSVTADQNNANLQYHRAYFFGKHMNPQTSLDGGILFTLSIPESLQSGMHTIEVNYFAETTAFPNDNTISAEYYARLGGQQFGDNNNRFNYYEKFQVNITGTPPIPPPIVPINQTIPVVPTCPEGTTYEAVSNTCTYNPPTQTVCTTGVYDASIGKCVVNPLIGSVCVEGTFNPSTNKCEITPANPGNLHHGNV